MLPPPLRHKKQHNFKILMALPPRLFLARLVAWSSLSPADLALSSSTLSVREAEAHFFRVFFAGSSGIRLRAGSGSWLFSMEMISLRIIPCEARSKQAPTKLRQCGNHGALGGCSLEISDR